MKRSALLSLLFILVLITAPAAGSPPPAVTAAPRLTNLTTLSQTAQARGSLPVIVTLNTPFQAEAGLADADAVAVQRAALLQAQTALLSRLANGFDSHSVKTFTFIPAMALQVTPAGLAALGADPAVLHIQEDLPVPADLAQSVTLIGAPAVWASGTSGAGQTVAVLDTGVDKNHPFLLGKVVSEACYSTTNDGFGSTSICPDGNASSTADDSALPYATGVCPAGKCDHGTHVAGIAAGKDPGGAGATGFSGVAKDATLIAIQVFSVFPGSYASCGGSACALSYTSDQILGLQRVYDLRTTYAIAAVNMSLGGGFYGNSQQALCDSDNAATKAAIDALRTVNIATVVASGNSGYTNGMSAPACISTAISVGAVSDGTPSTAYATPDVVTSYSNAATYLNLLAPGSLITSSIPGGSYADKEGTSMASPHVAGAWAVMKSKYPTATVSQVLNTLAATGTPITDLRAGANNLVKPRIRLDQAAAGYTVTGKVTNDGVTGVAGVTISTASGLISTVTDATGSYTLSDLLAGSYTITPSLGSRTFTPATRAATVGPAATGVDFISNTPLFSITGKVTTNGTTGIAGVSIVDNQGHVASTNASGAYALNGLAAGSYTLVAIKTGYRFSPTNQPVTLSAGQANINFTGTAGGKWIFIPKINK